MNRATQQAPRHGATSMGVQDEFPPVMIDADATQKFVEIEVQWGDGALGKSSVLVRGIASADLHYDAAAPTIRQLREARIPARVVGGGRIKHDSEAHVILVYGYSLDYGQPNFTRVVDLCQEAYPDYFVIGSPQGY